MKRRFLVMAAIIGFNCGLFAMDDIPDEGSQKENEKLIKAIKKSAIESAKQALANGAQLSARDWDTPILNVAAAYSDEKMFEFIIDRAANGEDFGYLLRNYDMMGRTIFMVLKNLEGFKKASDRKKTQYLVAKIKEKLGSKYLEKIKDLVSLPIAWSDQENQNAGRINNFIEEAESIET